MARTSTSETSLNAQSLFDDQRLFFSGWGGGGGCQQSVKQQTSYYLRTCGIRLFRRMITLIDFFRSYASSSLATYSIRLSYMKKVMEKNYYFPETASASFKIKNWFNLFVSSV